MKNLFSGKWGDLAALLAGATLPLALAPFDWWWFAPLPLLAYLFGAFFYLA